MNKTTNIIINLWNVQWIDSTILQKNKSDLKLFARWFKLLKYTYTFSAPVNRWDLFSWLNLLTAKTKISLKQLVQRKQNAFVHVHWPCIQCKLIIWPRENKQNSCTFRWKYWSRWLCWSFNRIQRSESIELKAHCAWNIYSVRNAKCRQNRVICMQNID